MDALEILQILVRRWWVVLPVMALTVGGAFSVGQSQPPEYQREMAMLVLGPAEAPTVDGEPGSVSNPYRGVGLDTTAQALAIVGQSAPARQAAREAGVATTYGVSFTRNSPIIKIKATGDAPDAVISTLTFVSGFLSAELEKRQGATGTSPENLVTLDVLDPPDGPMITESGAVRAQVAVGAAGLLLAVLLAVILDRVLRARRRSPDVAEQWPLASPRPVTVVARPGGAAARVPAPGAGPHILDAEVGGERRMTGPRSADSVEPVTQFDDATMRRVRRKAAP